MPRIAPSQVVSLIDKIYPQFRPESRNRKQWLNLLMEHCHGLRAIVQLIDAIPSHLILLDSADYVAFVTCRAAVSGGLANPKRHGHGFKVELPSLDEFGGHNPVTILRDLLAKCPDEFPEPASLTLNFITDKDLRDNLRVDIGAIDRALANSEWKAATVLSGSVLEALLLWTLQNQPLNKVAQAVAKLNATKKVPTKLDPNSLTSWHLAEYIEVSAELGVITATTADQLRLAKDFRNLIHPGRTIRLGQVCNRGTALSAVAGVELLVQDVGP